MKTISSEFSLLHFFSVFIFPLISKVNNQKVIYNNERSYYKELWCNTCVRSTISIFLLVSKSVHLSVGLLNCDLLIYGTN